MAKFKDKLYSLLKEQRTKARIPKDIAWEFQLTKDEKENIIGPIEDDGSSSRDYVYAIYPWEHNVYALTEHGWNIPLKSVIQEPTFEKLYNSISARI